MTREELQPLVAKSLRAISIFDVFSPNMTLEDCGLDSLDVVDFRQDLEDELFIELPDFEKTISIDNLLNILEEATNADTNKT